MPDKPIFEVIRLIVKIVEMENKAKRKSQSERAVSERRKRAMKANERQFNNPLRLFLECKYPAVFAEYTELYNLLKENHPNRKNLTKTSTFREWKARNTTPVMPAVIPQPEDVLTRAVRETLSTDQLPDEGQQLPPPQQGPQDIRQEIDDILNEMMADEDLGNFLQEPNPVEDEGIELNLLDEIYHDIEPFDYELEVEANGF